VEVIELAARDERLLQLLKKHHSSRTNRIIIFVLYKKEAPRVESLLNRKGFNVRRVVVNCHSLHSKCGVFAPVLL
jgi:ATP-dependent RNA helicase DBP3